MPDWTERLTEKERTDLHETDYESATTTELQDLHLSALRTVAVLRELVAEKDKVLETCKQLAIDRVRVADAAVKQDVFAADALMGIAKTAKDALALTEDDMLKRMEEK